MIVNISFVVHDDQPQVQVDFQGIGVPTVLDQLLVEAVEAYVSTYEAENGIEAVVDLVREFQANTSNGVAFDVDVASDTSEHLLAIVVAGIDAKHAEVA